jgi:hypothetical protein
MKDDCLPTRETPARRQVDDAIEIAEKIEI